VTDMIEDEVPIQDDGDPAMMSRIQYNTGGQEWPILISVSNAGQPSVTFLARAIWTLSEPNPVGS